MQPVLSVLSKSYVGDVYDDNFSISYCYSPLNHAIGLLDESAVQDGTNESHNIVLLRW